MKHMLDLFSGLGGASEAMVQDDTWSVLRIENNPLLGGVPFTIIDDVRNLQPHRFDLGISALQGFFKRLLIS